MEAIRLKGKIEKMVYRFYRDVVGKRRYMFQSIKHLMIFRIGIQPFVMKKGLQYDGVITHWKKRNIAGGRK